MSTKIYGAYKFDGNTVECLKTLKVIRKKWIEKYYEDLNKWLTIEYKNEEIDSIRKLYKILFDVMNKGHSGPLNLTSCVMIYPYRDDIYVQFFDLPKEIKLSKKFIDFHYQDQTDPPEDVLYKEFKKRGKIWNKIFGEDGIPGRAGFTFQIVDLSNLFNFLVDYKEEVRKDKNNDR